MRWTALAASVSLFGICVFLRNALERDPVTHVLVMLPLLAAAGWLLASTIETQGWRPSQPVANAATLLGVFVILFWMLPRYIDASLTNPLVELAKFVTIPIGVGAVLSVSWRAAHPMLRGFLKANAISMLGVLAFLFTHAPVRICNSYLVSDQERLGVGFLVVAVVLAVAWVVPLFFPTKTRIGPVHDATGEAAT